MYIQLSLMTSYFLPNCLPNHWILCRILPYSSRYIANIYDGVINITLFLFWVSVIFWLPSILNCLFFYHWEIAKRFGKCSTHFGENIHTRSISFTDCCILRISLSRSLICINQLLRLNSHQLLLCSFILGDLISCAQGELNLRL